MFIVTPAFSLAKLSVAAAVFGRPFFDEDLKQISNLFFSLSSCLQGFWWLHLETWSLIPSILFSFRAKIAVQSVVLKGRPRAFSFFFFGYAITFFLTILVCLLCIRAAMVCLPLAQCPLYSHLSVPHCTLLSPLREFIKIAQMAFVAAEFWQLLMRRQQCAIVCCLTAIFWQSVRQRLVSWTFSDVHLCFFLKCCCFCARCWISAVDRGHSGASSYYLHSTCAPFSCKQPNQNGLLW